MGFVFYMAFSELFIVSFNYILLFALFIFSLRLIFFNSTKGEYILLSLIILVLPGSLFLSYILNGTTYSSHTIGHFGSLRFDPYSFFLLILYCLVNRHNMMQLFGKLLLGSIEEQVEKQKKLVNFYYDKFTNCTDDELNTAFSLVKEYPEEAQIALKQIHQERNLSLLNI